MARPAAPYRAVLIACDTPVDRRWSGWLTARLRRFRTPHALMRAGVAQRVAPIVQLFASAQGDLSEAACAILAHCDALVVVCSTATPASRWIASAIHHYRETAGRERIFALLAEGEPDQAFPEALLRRAITREREGGLCETVWEEAEPIAADVRPRADEPRRATLRRALLRTAAGLLGVSFDQLARRERHRRLQRQRLIGGLCAGALAAGAALAWWQWDSRQLKRAYYEAYATHWGMPSGRNRVSVATASHRGGTYLIETRDGLVLRLVRLDGLGKPVAAGAAGPAGVEAWNSAVAEWRFHYDHRRLAAVDCLDEHGTALRVDRWAWQADGAAVVTYFHPDGGIYRLDGDVGVVDSSPGDPGQSPSNVAQHRVVFTASGLEAARYFRTLGGSPAHEAGRRGGRAYGYDAAERLINARDLDSQGQLLQDGTGIAQLRLAYDGKGRVAQGSWLDARGRAVLSARGVAATLFAYDGYGNLARTTYLGLDGKPVARSDWHVAGFAQKVDAHGRPVEIAYFGVDGQPAVAADSGASLLRMTYDDSLHGRITRYLAGPDSAAINPASGASIETDMFDAAGRLTRTDFYDGTGARVADRQSGAAVIQNVYDAAGHLTGTGFFGTDLRPGAVAGGHASIGWTYDPHGRIRTEAYYDAAGQLMARRDLGYASLAYAYDDAGEVTSVTRYAASGKLSAKAGTNIAETAYTYDSFGNVVTTAFHGVNQQAVDPSHGGPALIQDDYDAFGNIDTERYYNAAGALTQDGATGCYRRMFSRDERGNIDWLFCSGPDGAPGLLRDTPVSAINYVFNAENQRIGYLFVDRDFRPVADPRTGVAEVRFAYDGHYRLIETRFLDVQGHPVRNRQLGYARASLAYDRAGNIVESRYFGIDDQPVEAGPTHAVRTVVLRDGNGNPLSVTDYDARGHGRRAVPHMALPLADRAGLEPSPQ